MSKPILTALVALLLVGAGCEDLKEPIDCRRFVPSRQEDCRWCEENGGRYMSVTAYRTECVFPPKDGVGYSTTVKPE